MMQNENRKILLFPIFLVLYEIAIYLTNDAYLPALPQIKEDFATTIRHVQWTLTLWCLGSCSMQLILGPIADRFGRRPVLLYGGLLFILSTWMCASTQSMGLFLFARFLQGAAIPSMSIAGYAVIHELFDQRKAIKTLAWMNSVTVLAPSFGPLLGSLLLLILDWRWIFGILAIWAILALILLKWMMPETLTKEMQHPIELKRVTRQYLNIFCNRNFLLCTLMVCCTFGAMITWIAASPFLVMTIFDVSQIHYGLVQLIVFGSFIVAARILSNLLHRFSINSVILFSVILSFLSSVLLLFITYWEVNVLNWMIVCMTLIAFSGGLLFPLLTRLAVDACIEPMGARMSVFFTLETFFAVLASWVASWVGLNLVGFAFVVFIFHLALVYLYWRRQSVECRPHFEPGHPRKSGDA